MHGERLREDLNLAQTITEYPITSNQLIPNTRYPIPGTRNVKTNECL